MKIELPYACDKTEEYLFVNTAAINALVELFQRVEANSEKPLKWTYTGVLPTLNLVYPDWNPVSFYGRDKCRTGFVTVDVQVVFKPSLNVALVKTAVERVNLKTVQSDVVRALLLSYIPF